MTVASSDDGDDLEAALLRLASFLAAKPLTARIADLEHNLAGASGADVNAVLAEHDIDAGLLAAALATRRQLGRLNDLIHATAIGLTLPSVLDDLEERLARPSLAAGNDPSRPFDVESNARVAEFKLSRWLGNDAMRKRGVFKDLVHLAADETDRAKQLFVVGQLPIRFLQTTTAKAAWGLDKFPSTRVLFEERFGSLDMPISQFTAGPGAVVELVDLEQRFPDLFAAL